MAQKCLSTDGGWPVPSKYAHVYKNLLANCPYKQFFDIDTLCNSANAENISQLSKREGKDAQDLFNATFRNGNGGSGTMNTVKTSCCGKNKSAHLNKQKVSSFISAHCDFSHNKRFYNIATQTGGQTIAATSPRSPDTSHQPIPLFSSTLLSGKRRTRPSFLTRASLFKDRSGSHVQNKFPFMLTRPNKLKSSN
jgi:hypothetical protein